MKANTKAATQREWRPRPSKADLLIWNGGDLLCLFRCFMLLKSRNLT